MGDGFVYQFAARASSPLSRLAFIRLLPTAGRAGKVMATEVVAQALEVRDRQMAEGSAESQPSDSHSLPQVWGFNPAYDNTVGTLVFGSVADAPGEVLMLRATLACAAPWWGQSESGLSVGVFPVGA